MNLALRRYINFEKDELDNIDQPEDIVKQDLITDMFGIYASVLLKHQKVDCIKEFIDSVE